jgi:hypothetical protein
MILVKPGVSRLKDKKLALAFPARLRAESRERNKVKITRVMR